jgi:hypothetical protein
LSYNGYYPAIAGQESIAGHISSDEFIYTFEQQPGVTAYDWSVAGNAFLSASGNEATLSFSNENAYEEALTLNLTTAEGCTETVAKAISVDSPVGIESLISSGALSIYPNPTADKVYIKSDQIAFRTATVRSLQGKTLQVYSGDIQQLDLTELDQGTYMLELETDSERYQYKLVRK